MFVSRMIIHVQDNRNVFAIFPNKTDEVQFGSNRSIYYHNSFNIFDLVYFPIFNDKQIDLIISIVVNVLTVRVHTILFFTFSHRFILFFSRN